MELIIPTEVEKVIKNIGNKTKQKNAYKIYAAMCRMEILADKNGFFPLPSKYLKKINDRYNLIINAFLENNIIDYEHYFDFHPITFERIKRKRYNVEKGLCMKYKFLINIDKGISKEIDFENSNNFRWFEIIKRSLNELGYDYKISRVSFGRRVYYGLIKNYKKELRNKGLCIIDAKASQPKLLLQELQKNNTKDKNLEEAFKNDFYTYLADNLNLKSREQAKEHFMYYLNGNGYTLNNDIYALFPEASLFLKNIKRDNYKNSSHYFQKLESQIWIDDLLNNIPVDFALPVHDCLIIKEIEAELVLEYCKQKYPNIDFVLGPIEK